MTDLERRLQEDQALRDSALALFKADLALVREDVQERGVGARAATRVGEATLDVLGDAVNFADENRGQVAAAAAAAVLWFAREPLIGFVSGLLSDDEEPGASDSRSDEE